MIKWENVLGLISICVALLSFLNKEDRLLAAFILTVAIVFYIINSFSYDIDEYEIRIKKLEEKLKIHDQLIDLKSDVEYLKKETIKRGRK